MNCVNIYVILETAILIGNGLMMSILNLCLIYYKDTKNLKSKLVAV